jgi:hypothetical protein
MPKKTNWEKVVKTINGHDAEKRDAAAEQLRPQFEKMESEIRDQIDISLLEGDLFRVAVIHSILKKYMDAIEAGVNRSKSVVNVVDDGEMILTLSDGRKLSAQRTIKREI